MARKPKRGRYTPKKDHGKPEGIDLGTMNLTSGQVRPEDGETREATQRRFFENTLFPQGLVLLRARTDKGNDPSMPGMLVALIPPEEVDADVRRVLEARAVEPDALRWADSIQGQVGWTTMASISGDPVADAEASFAKLNLDLSAPMRYKASFVFHLAQSRDVVEAVARGGFFAFAVPELVRELAALDFADAMAALPYFSLPAAPQLTQLLQHLARPS